MLVPIRRRAQVATCSDVFATSMQAIVVMDSNNVPGMQEFAYFSLLASAYKTSLSPARNVLPQPLFYFLVEVALGL